MKDFGLDFASEPKTSWNICQKCCTKNAWKEKTAKTINFCGNIFSLSHTGSLLYGGY